MTDTARDWDVPYIPPEGIQFDGAAFGCGPWLNQWAENPDRPHPHAVATERIRRDYPWLLEGDGKAS